jgi:hypothetical protein
MTYGMMSEEVYMTIRMKGDAKPEIHLQALARVYEKWKLRPEITGCARTTSNSALTPMGTCTFVPW